VTDPEATRMNVVDKPCGVKLAERATHRLGDLRPIPEDL
jgi:hypothetical protein